MKFNTQNGAAAILNTIPLDERAATRYDGYNISLKLEMVVP